MTAPDPAFVVQQQLFPPGPKPPDAIKVYDGVDPAKGQGFSFTAWDLRGPVLKLCWDLLRFQVIDRGKLDTDRAKPMGLRDQVTSILYLTEQNNQILRKLAAAASISLTDLT